MAFDIRAYVSNHEDPRYRETYRIINELVNEAGHITIRDLFVAPREKIGEKALFAIQQAKQIGFLNLNNGQCCSGDRCVPSPRGYCNPADDGGCSAASDACDNLGTFRMSEMSRLQQPDTGLGEVTEI